MMVRCGAHSLSKRGITPANKRRIWIMTVRRLVLSALAIVAVAGSAAAGERVDVTPTLYREQARATAAVRPASELSTTPRLVPAAPADRRVVAEATGR
jgi:predicted anti-sigma-YlaC factor YlaD